MPLVVELAMNKYLLAAPVAQRRKYDLHKNGCEQTRETRINRGRVVHVVPLAPESLS